VSAHLGASVVALDAVERTLQTAAGERYEYEDCLVATGADPLRPPLRGGNDPRVHVLRTLEDADLLKGALADGPKRAVVAGASMVGIKMVEVLLRCGIDTVLCDSATQVFPLAAHKHCADLIEERLSRRGVELRLGRALLGVEPGSAELRVCLSEGEEFAADLVILALGVHPRLDFLDAGQVEMDLGLLVDDHCRTSAARLFAARDCSQGMNLLSSRREIIGLLANACYQGRCAGRNMAGQDDRYAGGLPAHVIRFFDTLFVAIGTAQGGETALEIAPAGGESYCRLAAVEGRLVGANLLDRCEASGPLKQALLRQTRAAGLARGNAAAGAAATDLGAPPAAPANGRLDWSALCERLFGLSQQESLLDGALRKGDSGWVV
jgi:3-phenylpropionate/trans-cinnamate dioxygenase ferredoxin reductase subunit